MTPNKRSCVRKKCLRSWKEEQCVKNSACRATLLIFIATWISRCLQARSRSRCTDKRVDWLHEIGSESSREAPRDRNALGKPCRSKPTVPTKFRSVSRDKECVCSDSRRPAGPVSGPPKTEWLVGTMGGLGLFMYGLLAACCPRPLSPRCGLNGRVRLLPHKN